MRSDELLENTIRSVQFPVAKKPLKAALREIAMTGAVHEARTGGEEKRSTGTWLVLAWSAIAACALLGLMTWQSLLERGASTQPLYNTQYAAGGAGDVEGETFPPSFPRGDSMRSGFFAKALARNDVREKLLLVAGGAVRALSTTDGSELWSYPVNGPCVSLNVRMGIVFLTDHAPGEDNNAERPILVALNAADGKVKYRHDPWGGVEDVDCTVQRVALSRHVAFLAVKRNAPEPALVLAAMDSLTGEVLWERALESAATCTNLAVADGKLMASFAEGWFAAMNPLNGIELWRFYAPQQGAIEDFTTAGKLVLLAGEADVFALASDGRELWRLFTDPKGVAPALRKGRGRFVAADDHMVEVNVLNGNIAWRRDFSDKFEVYAALSTPLDVTLCTMRSKPDSSIIVKAFQSDNHHALWETQVWSRLDYPGWAHVECRDVVATPEALFETFSEPTNEVSTESARGVLVKLDIYTGNVLWRKSIDALSLFSPIVVR